MIIKYGDMWLAINENVSHFCFTTNATITKGGLAVLGRGIAKQAERRFPDLPKLLANRTHHLVTYGIRQLGSFPIKGHRIVMTAFQVKNHWKQPADVDLIEYSTQLLLRIAKGKPNKIILLNYPGIGNGRLSEELVFPIINVLPDNVHIYKYK